MCKIKSCTRSRDCLVDTWGRIVSPWALFSLQFFHVFSISQVETRLGQPSTWASYLTPGIRLFAEASTMVVVRMKSLPTVYRLQHAGALGMAQQETLAVTCSHLHPERISQTSPKWMRQRMAMLRGLGNFGYLHRAYAPWHIACIQVQCWVLLPGQLPK
jgi:hypothetical protein